MIEATKGRGPGQWWPTQQQGGSMSATIYCRDCGRPSSLSAHVIQPDGTVSPSCVCPHAKVDEVECPCGFHEFVKLSGWEVVTLMAMTEPKNDAELRSMGIDPEDAAQKAASTVAWAAGRPDPHP